jgi:hypothetical protein
MDFRWLKGERLIKYYESLRGYQRGFCSDCGSPIINRVGPNWTAPAAFPRYHPRGADKQRNPRFGWVKWRITPLANPPYSLVFRSPPTLIPLLYYVHDHRRP